MNVETFETWPFQPFGGFITPNGPPADGDSGKGLPW